MKRAKLGDIIEIATPLGLVYAQYTHRNDEYGELLRVYSQRYADRPTDIGQILRSELQLMCFYPLQAAIKFRLVEVVGHCPVPPESSTFPLFRTGIENKVTLKVKTWWFWDGEKEWPHGDLTPEQRRYPMRGIWNHEFLIDRIVSGWRAETDPS
jgi:hypothetical protein